MPGFGTAPSHPMHSQLPVIIKSSQWCTLWHQHAQLFVARFKAIKRRWKLLLDPSQDRALINRNHGQNGTAALQKNDGMKRALIAMAPGFVEKQMVDSHGGKTGLAAGAIDEYVIFSELYAAGIKNDDMEATLTMSGNCPARQYRKRQRDKNLHKFCWLRHGDEAVCAAVRSRQLRWQHGQFFIRKVHSSIDPTQLIELVQHFEGEYKDECNAILQMLDANTSVALSCYFEPYNLDGLLQPN